MQKVMGQYRTKYGPAHFVIHTPSSAKLHIGTPTRSEVWTINGVEYKGHTEVHRNFKHGLSQSWNLDWQEKAGSSYIQRGDGKDIDYMKSNTLEKIRNVLVECFIEYITHPHNGAVMDLVHLTNLESVRDSLVTALAHKEEELRVAKNVYERWQRENLDNLTKLRERCNPDDLPDGITLISGY